MRRGNSKKGLVSNVSEERKLQSLASGELTNSVAAADTILVAVVAAAVWDGSH